jgi:hypothetical protein
MSGLQTQPMYDANATTQKLVQITSINQKHNYLLNAYENYPTTNIVSTCDGKFLNVSCEVCDANKGSVTNTLENIDYRISVDNELRGTTVLLSDFDGDKYRPYYADGKENPYKPVVQPLLCERSINPTNMKPYASAYPDQSLYYNYGFMPVKQ